MHPTIRIPSVGHKTNTTNKDKDVWWAQYYVVKPIQQRGEMCKIEFNNEEDFLQWCVTHDKHALKYLQGRFKISSHISNLHKLWWGL